MLWVSEMEVFKERTGDNAGDIARSFTSSSFKAPFVLVKAIEHNKSNGSSSTSSCSTRSKSDSPGDNRDDEESQKAYKMPYVRLHPGLTGVPIRDPVKAFGIDMSTASHTCSFDQISRNCSLG